MISERSCEARMRRVSRGGARNFTLHLSHTYMEGNLRFRMDNTLLAITQLQNELHGYALQRSFVLSFFLKLWRKKLRSI